MSLTDLIYGWVGGRDWFERGALITYLNRKLGRAVSVAEIDATLNWLSQRGEIESKNERYKLCEYDPVEKTLYPKLEIQLTGGQFINELSVKPGSFVFQNTSTGGPRGDGRLAQPDFTMATIQTWRFDPTATLEVFSFEVKNRAGSSVTSVYETLAHGRYVHYPYLVYPCSRFDSELNQALRTNCERVGIGLISFKIAVKNPSEYDVDDLQLVVRGERKSPNPYDTENFLKKRLTPDNCAALDKLAKGREA